MEKVINQNRNLLSFYLLNSDRKRDTVLKNDLEKIKKEIKELYDIFERKSVWLDLGCNNPQIYLELIDYIDKIYIYEKSDKIIETFVERLKFEIKEQKLNQNDIISKITFIKTTKNIENLKIDLITSLYYIQFLNEGHILNLYKKLIEKNLKNEDGIFYTIYIQHQDSYISYLDDHIIPINNLENFEFELIEFIKSIKSKVFIENYKDYIIESDENYDLNKKHSISFFIKKY